VASSHLARHDIIAAAFAFGAIALYVSEDTPSLTIKSVLCGLAIGLALDIHQNVVVFGPVMLTLFLLDYGRGILRTGRFWGFCLGGSLGVLFYAAMHILPYPGTYFAIASLGNGSTRTPPIFTLDLRVWQGSLVDTINFLDLAILILAVPAGIFLIRRQSKADIKVLALFGVTLLSMAAVINVKLPYYAILIAPTLPLMVAPYIDHVTQKIGKVTEWAFWRNLAVISAVIAIACINLSPAVLHNNNDYEKVASYLQQTVPNGSLVYGSPAYWLALSNTRYVNWEQLTLQQKAIPGGTFTDAVEAIKPDYLVVYSFMEDYTIDDAWCHANSVDFACALKTELNPFLKQNATLAGELSTGTYEDIRIYKMNWANGEMKGESSAFLRPASFVRIGGSR